MPIHLLEEGSLEAGPGAEAAMASLDQRVFDAIVRLVAERPVLANSLERNLRYCVLRELAQTGVQMSWDMASIKLDPADLESALGMAFESVVPDIAMHTRSVAQRTIDLSMDLGIPAERLRLVSGGGLLHDVGKMDPDVYRLISLPRRLTPKEKTVVKMHPVIGKRVLEAFGVDPLICAMAGQHHERFDGTGYPFRRSLGEASIEVGILTVADAVDAITADRPGRNGRGIDGVLGFLEKGRGGHFDPAVVDAFKRTCGSLSA